MPICMARVNTSRETSDGIMLTQHHGAGLPQCQFRTISPFEFELMDAMFDTNASCRAAYEAICRGMFAAPLMLTGIDVDEPLRRALACEYTSMASDAVRDLLKYGIVIITLDRNTMLPYVIPPTLLRIQHRHTIGGPSEYRIFPAQNASLVSSTSAGLNDVPMDDVLVFEANRPDTSGHLTGPMCALLHMTAFRNAMLRCASVAFQRMAIPFVFITSKEPSVASESDARNFTGIGDSEALATHTADIAARQQADYERAQLEYRAARLGAIADPFASGAALGGGPMSSSDRTRHALFGGGQLFDPLLRLPAYTSDGAHLEPPAARLLPTNRDITAAPQSSAPQNIEGVEETVEQEVAKTFAVPTVFWSGQRRSSVATNETVLTVFYNTLQTWRSDLQLVFEVVLVFTVGDRQLEQLAAATEAAEAVNAQLNATAAERQESATKDSVTENADDDADGDDTAARKRRVASDGSGPRGPGRDKRVRHLPPVAEEHEQQRVAAYPVNTPVTASAAMGAAGNSDAGAAEQKHGYAPYRRRRGLSGRFSVRTQRLSVTFPALLDHTIIDSMRRVGLIDWDTYRVYMSRYYGVDPRDLCAKQLEPTTQLPLAEETQRVRRIEEAAMERGLVQAMETGSESLRALTGNDTMTGAPFTGARRLPKKSASSVAASRIPSGSGDTKGGQPMQPKPARSAAVASKNTASHGPRVDKGSVHTDRSRRPESGAPLLSTSK